MALNVRFDGDRAVGSRCGRNASENKDITVKRGLSLSFCCSDRYRLAVFTPYLSESIADLSNGDVGLDSGQDVREKI